MINVSENIISGAARYHPVRGWQGGKQEEEEYRPDQRGDDFFPHSASFYKRFVFRRSTLVEI